MDTYDLENYLDDMPAFSVLKALNARNEDALTCVFRMHYGELCKYSERVVGDAEAARDVVSHVFLNFVEKPKEYNSMAHVKFYLLRSTRNASVSHLRSVKNMHKRHVAYSALPVFDYDMAKENMLESVWAAFSILPPKSLVVMCLYMDGLKAKEIAELLHTTPNNVGSVKLYALGLLRQYLLKNGMSE